MPREVIKSLIVALTDSALEGASRIVLVGSHEPIHLTTAPDFTRKYSDPEGRGRQTRVCGGGAVDGCEKSGERRCKESGESIDEEIDYWRRFGEEPPSETSVSLGPRTSTSSRSRASGYLI